MIRTLLWDFGDTLVDERWMLTPPAGYAAWSGAYLLCETKLGDDWIIGKIDTRSVAKLLAERVQMELRDVIDHMEQASRSITFFDGVYRYARSASLPRAIVTLNPDLFTEVVAAHYDHTGG